MKTPTFEEQYQKIVSAYYKNELNPLQSCACFIGNMLNNNETWSRGRDFYNRSHGWNIMEECDKSQVESALECLKQESNSFYTIADIIKLEQNFLRISIPINCIINAHGHKIREDNLFKAMESTLEMLREIHESKGEIVKDYNFVKREVVNV